VLETTDRTQSNRREEIVSCTTRPRWKSVGAVVEFIDTCLRPIGYRLAGAFEESPDAAVSVIGFRKLRSTAWGRYMYVDDVSTVEAARGRGYADRLMQWVIAEAHRRNYEGVHLDSGLGIERASAHRLYMRNHFRISAHHFSLAVDC
jgi:GNAT superfamily N-acetyltransferase